MIILNVTYQCKSGMRDAYLKALNEEGLVEACRNEDGNLSYKFYFDPVDEDALLLVEKWKDAEALAIHNQMPHFKRTGEIKAEYIESTLLEKMTLL